MTTTTLVLITADPHHPIANHALRYTKSVLALNKTQPSSQTVHVFFYGAAAHTANKLRWQVADRNNLTSKWQQLSDDFGITLPVCVSTALVRGVSDADNAERHQLDSNNLAAGFALVGLSELADKLSAADTVVQF